MKKLTPLSALFLIACGTSAPTQSSDTASSTATGVGSAAEAIRQLGKNDADVVSKCEDLVKRCEAFAGDSGVGGAVCDEIGTHCDELAQQLNDVRDQFQQCLAKVATCEASAKNPADCAAQRAACDPADKDFQDRRGATLACAERTQSCLPQMRGPGERGKADDADAGANQCDVNALDFVGCCHGHGGGHDDGDADAGARQALPFGQGHAMGPGAPGAGAGPGAGLPGAFGMTPRPPADHGRGNNADDPKDDGSNSGDGNR